ncbi:phage portal protein [Streptomyces sp. NPDC001774]
MGVWQDLRSFGGLLMPGRKDFRSGGWDGVQPEMWSSQHPLAHFVSTSTPDQEMAENDFEGYVQHLYKENGAVFACMQARSMVFSEARFLFRRYEKGRPGELFSGSDLALLERPWPGGTTGELLARMEQDVALAGNFYATRCDDVGRLGKSAKSAGLRVTRLRPDWVTIVIGTRRADSRPEDPDARVLGYFYRPRTTGVASGEPKDPVFLLADEVCHYSPNPDPLARYRGMSWLTPIIREIQADTGFTVHKKRFLENAAVPNLAVSFGPDVSDDDFDEFVATFKAEHRGAWNAYKTLFMKGGADVTPLTMDFRQLEFTQSVGKGESRIAAVAGVPSSWVGFSEGMQGSSLNAGNFTASRRRFADGTIRPLWRMAAASLEVLVNLPAGAHLWYDERDIAFLREDAMDRAEIMRVNLNALDAAIKAGFEPDAGVEAVRDNDIAKLLGRHTGLVSVQMQPPMDATDTAREDADVKQVEASIIANLAPIFELDSIIAALTSGDWSQLKEDPNHARQAEAAARGQEAAADEAARPPEEKPPPARRNDDDASGGGK